MSVLRTLGTLASSAAGTAAHSKHMFEHVRSKNRLAEHVVEVVTGAPCTIQKQDFGRPAPVVVDFLYTIRRVGKPNEPAQIPAWIAENSLQPLNAAGFDDAVRMAQKIAKPYRDEIHIMPINWAHAVLQDTDGTWHAGALVGDHRQAVAPLFIDGRFMDLFSESLELTRIDPRVQAVVGPERVMDLRATGHARIDLPDPATVPGMFPSVPASS